MEETTHQTYTTTATATPRVLVICCGDPRFQGPIRQFLEKELGIKEGDYLPLIVRGGVASFTVSDFLPKEAKYVTEGATNYIQQFSSIGRVILINHEDCGKYKILQKVAPFFFAAMKDVLDRQRSDLNWVATQFAKISPRHVVVEKYFARFANQDHTEVLFEKQ